MRRTVGEAALAIFGALCALYAAEKLGEVAGHVVYWATVTRTQGA